MKKHFARAAFAYAALAMVFGCSTGSLPSSAALPAKPPSR